MMSMRSIIFHMGIVGGVHYGGGGPLKKIRQSHRHEDVDLKAWSNLLVKVIFIILLYYS